MAAMVRLRPGEWTLIPDTRCEVRWDGEDTITVHRRDGIWDLSPASSSPGRVMAWVRITRDGRPPTPAWPLVPLSRGAVYRGRGTT